MPNEDKHLALFHARKAYARRRMSLLRASREVDRWYEESCRQNIIAECVFYSLLVKVLNVETLPTTWRYGNGDEMGIHQMCVSNMPSPRRRYIRLVSIYISFSFSAGGLPHTKSSVAYEDG